MDSSFSTLQNCQVLDLKEASAVALCRQYQESFPREILVDQKCKECDRYRLCDERDERGICVYCNFTPWLKEHQLPRELEGYCLNVLKDMNLYYQTFIPDDQSSFGYSIFDDSDELELDTSDELETSDDEQEQVSDISLD